jgi:hypothetical protein
MATVSLTPSQIPISTQSRTPLPSITPLPTLTSTITNTPQPPLVAQEWKPAPILITYSQDWFGFCGDVCPPDPPPFVLYGDGNLIIHGPFDPDNGDWHYLYKKLDRSEICQILNAIDQTGFFDFNPSTYVIGGVADAANWRVEVHAWRNKDVKVYGLGEEIDYLNYNPNLIPSEVVSPSSIRDAFTLLYNFPVDGLGVYIPNLLGIWIWKSETSCPRSKAWTIDNISLAKLFDKTSSVVDALPRPIYLDGKDAESIYAMFDNFNYYGEVTQYGVTYRVNVRPILPFEIISKDSSVISPNIDQMKLPSSLQCSPSDGIMPIPLYGPK